MKYFIKYIELPDKRSQARYNRAEFITSDDIELAWGELCDIATDDGRALELTDITPLGYGGVS